MRMIERWFPCAEVSEACSSGWGAGGPEKALFTWFAARPLAQARAAVLTSLLPWPEDESEQRRLQDLVRRALQSKDKAQLELTAELSRWCPEGASLLDPFAGRATIPLEGSRLGVRSVGVDYSPVATLAGQLLAEFPQKDWSSELMTLTMVQGGQCGVATIDPVEQVQDDVERLSQAVGGSRAVAAALGAAAPAVQQMPLRLRAHDPGLDRRSGRQYSVEPRIDPIEVVHPIGQHPGVDEHPADEVDRAARWRGV